MRNFRRARSPWVRRRALLDRNVSDGVIALLLLVALGVVAFMQRSPDTHRAATLPTGDTTYFRSCAVARAAGAAPLIAGGPGYRAGLDADGDGVACEPYLGP